jgi:hypothetical protein
MAVQAEAAERLRALAGAGEPADLDAVLALYDELPPVAEDAMLGDWDGQVIPTGHPGERHLGGLRWAGKRFTGRDAVDPMICLDERGERQANPILGDATLRTVEYRGVATATMVYDSHPIFDHFRRIDDDTVIGAMDRKGEPAPLVFLLRRRG